MKAVLNLFWQICLLRQSPEHIPTYSWFVVTVVVANVLGSIAMSATLSPEVELLTIATYIVVAMSVTAALVWLACYLREVPERFAATFTAVCGCDLIISALLAVTIPALTTLSESAGIPAQIGFTIWSMTVSGFILHRALDIQLGIGVLTAFGILLMSIAAGQVAITP